MPDPIPEDFRLLHVGPGKTGTTALQSAFHNNRDTLHAHGVHYAGRGRQPWNAANQALTLSPHVKQGPRDRWEALLADVEGAPSPRVVISSEAFGRADDEAAAAIVDALGRDRTRVVVTMRPPGDLLSSNWWQSVASGGRLSYNDWLDRVLNHADEEDGYRGFWFRTRFDKIVETWAGAVGADNVVAISLGGQPRDFVLRTFEQLVGLPPGVLEPGEGESNASLAHPVAETIRQFYEVRRAQGLKKNKGIDRVRGDALNLLRRNTHLLTGEEPIRTPAWAVEATSVVAREMNEKIRSLGVAVVGDLAALEGSSKPPPEIVETPHSVPVADAAALLHAMTRSAQLRQEQAVQAAREQAYDEGLRAGREELSPRELLTLLGRGLRRRRG